MHIKNSNDHYGMLSILLHWVMGALIIALLGIGLYMTDMTGPLKMPLYRWHKQLGVVVLMLAFIRLTWRFYSRLPSDAAHLPNYQKYAAKGAHYLLYFLMFSMPLSGWLMSSAAGYPVSFFGLFTLPKLIEPDQGLQHFFAEAHELQGTLLIGLIALHVLAPIYHYVVYRDAIMKKMLP